MTKLWIPLFLMTTAVVWAQPGRGMGFRGIGWDNMMNLTVAQQEQVTMLRSDYQKRRIDTQANLQKQRLVLRELMWAEKTNQKAIDAAIDKISAQENALQKLWVDHRLEVRTILTPGQRQLFDARPAGPGWGGRGAYYGAGPYGQRGRGGYGNRNW